MSFRKLLAFLLLALIQLLMGSCIENKNKYSNQFSIDDDGMLVIKGKREFIIGSYHLPKTEKSFSDLASRGYNYVRVSSAQEMDSAYKNDLFSWINTGSLDKEEDAERIRKLIEEFKDHPSLLFWEMEDEPAFTWNSAELHIPHSQMLKTYKFIKDLDSKHFVITNHGPVNLISTLQKYNSSTDVVSCDVYPVIPHGIKPSYALYPDGLQGDLLNPYISQVGEYVDKMKKIVHRSKPVFMVLQGFSWEMLKPEADRDSAMILYPTYEESRFMAFNAIIHEANGIIYWGTNYTPQPSPFIDDLNLVTKELAEMQEVLAAPAVNVYIEKEYHELGYTVDTGVEIMAKKVDGRTYLLTANSDKNSVKVSFKSLKGFSSVKVIKEKRSISITDNKFTDNFKPFGVHIYEFR